MPTAMFILSTVMPPPTMMGTDTIAGTVFSDRAAQCDAAAERVIVSRGQLEFAGKFVSRSRTLHINEPGQCVGPVTRSLGTSQDFNLFNIPQRRNRPDTAEIDIVHDKSDRRVWGALVLRQLTDPADLNVARPVTITGPVEIGQAADEFFKMLDGRSRDRFGVQHGDTGRDICSRPAAIIGGDNYFGECIVLGHGVQRRAA